MFQIATFDHQVNLNNIIESYNKITVTVAYSGISTLLGRNKLWVRFPAVSDIYPMFIEPTITQVPSEFSGYHKAWYEIVFKIK